MKRDMDMIRELLLKIEGGQRIFETASDEVAAMLGFTPEEPLSQQEADKLAEHLDLLEEAGLIKMDARMGGGSVLVERLTWKGHEFLDAIRDPEIWRRTRAGAEKAGGAGLEFIWELAKAYGKQVIKDRLQIDLP